ncbi:ABC transporter, putative [Giardia lamblia P15]|uniref:ABC transporter, putative n=1 Tax=Giardia intestinalis (strain P15) TaxID=658858 RepID=E1F2A0_GIAIA|nr:ABC transporter, putative [Giardia lamblia P15]
MANKAEQYDSYEFITPSSVQPQSERCPFILYYTFLWMTPFVVKAKKQRVLKPSDIPSLPANMTYHKVLTKLENALAVTRANVKPVHIGSLVMKISWPFFAISIVLMGLAVFLSFVQPKTMTEVLKVLDTSHIADLRDSSSSVLANLFRETWVWIVINLVAQLLTALFQSIASTICAEQSIRVSQAISMLLYKKLMRIPNVTATHVLSPTVITFINGDARSISNLVSNIPRMIAIPLKLLMIVLFLVFQIDRSALAGFGGILITLPFISLLILYNLFLEKRYAAARDVRARYVTEVITGLRVIKAYNYQELCRSRMHPHRRRELIYVGRMTLAQSCIHLMGYMTWPAMLLCAFLSMLKAGTFTTTNAYTAAYLFNIFARVLIDLPYLISSLSSAIVSCHRARQFLALPESDSYGKLHKKDDSAATQFAIWTVGNPSYSWGRQCHKHIPSSFNSNEQSHKAKNRRLLSMRARYFKVLNAYNTLKKRFPEDVLMGVESSGPIEKLSKATIGSSGGEDPHISDRLSLLKPKLAISDTSKCFSQIDRLKKYHIELAAMHRQITALQSSIHESETECTPLLKFLQFSIPKGCLVGVGGRVGSGKSSLLLAILGEMAFATSGNTDSAHIRSAGHIAYCSQVPSVLTGTIQFNIQLFLPYDEKRMQLATRLSCLDGDLSELPGGLATLVGSRGVTLSGGQKARLSLARAIYSDADIYLFDDLFASLDSHVCKFILSETIKGYLLSRGKTVVLATNQMHYFCSCSKVLFIDAGTVKEVTPESVDIECSPLPIAEVPSLTSTQIVERHDSGYQVPQVAAVLKEEKHTELGFVNSKYYKLWFKAGGTWRFIVYIIMWILCIFMLQLASLLINFWTEQRLGLSTDGYIGLFLSFSFGFMVILFIGQLFYMLFIRKAAERLYYSMEEGLINTAMSFYDAHPIGRILNRLIADTGTCDLTVKNGLAATCENSIFVLGSLLATLLMSWPSAFVLVPLLALFFWIFMGFRAVSPLLRRTTSLLNSHVCNFILDTYYNLASLRAYKYEAQTASYYARAVLAMEAAFWMDVSLYRWLHFTTTLLSICVSAVVTVSAVITSSFANGEIFSGTVLMNGFDVVMMLIDMCFGIVAMDLSMASVERVAEYATLEPESTNTPYTPSSLPTDSTLGFVVKDLSLRYQKHLPIVLHGISFTVAKGERVAIVGKTGSGKSSFVNAVLRLVEPEAGSEILLNGLNLLKMDLHQARSKVTLIPQDPFIFSGTLRVYLSGDRQFSDEELWRVLEKTHLREYFTAQSNQLDYQLVDNGSNLSLGQRQLLCIAHALLRDTEVILLDEVTAHVDSAAEVAIQDALWTHQEQKIIITIAHKLRTVCNQDRVIVMASGQIVEQGPPRVLFHKPDSIFANMIRCSIDSEDLIGFLTSM